MIFIQVQFRKDCRSYFTLWYISNWADCQALSELLKSPLFMSWTAWGKAWSAACLCPWVCCLWSWSLFWAIIRITTMLTRCLRLAWLRLTAGSRGESDLGGVTEAGGGETDIELFGERGSLPLEWWLFCKCCCCCCGKLLDCGLLNPPVVAAVA